MARQSLFTTANITALINAMKVVFPTREEVEKIVEEKLDEKIRFIPTKDEFFSRMDKLSGAHSDINDRFDRIDKHLGIISSA